MTQKEKVRAYDEALSVALETYKTQPMYKDWLEKMFPELRESDDEKIRKALIEMVHDTTGDSLWVDYNVHKEDAIAWLEKQGEHANFRNKIQIGDKVTKNRDGYLINLSQLNRVAKVEEKQGEQKPTDEEIKELLRTEYEKGRADAIAEMQKPAWSEEDKDVLEDIEEAIINYWHGDTQGILLEWLKSLEDRVQPKQEWSDEDEKKLLCICAWIKDYPRIADFTDEMYTVANNYVDWLKSLRPQWKPSEGQMIAISTAIGALGKGTLNGKQLIELQEQLKKLKGE